MTENKIAKILGAVGIIEACCGIIFALFISASDSDLLPFGAAVLIIALVNCLILFAFGEVIHLLQKNVEIQNSILHFLKITSTEEQTAPKTVLQDIEANLPRM